MTNLEGMPIYKARLSKAQRGGGRVEKNCVRFLKRIFQDSHGSSKSAGIFEIQAALGFVFTINIIEASSLRLTR